MLGTNLVEGVVLVLEAGPEEPVDLQGVVIRRQLERQGRMTPLLEALVGIQHLEAKEDVSGDVMERGRKQSK